MEAANLLPLASSIWESHFLEFDDSLRRLGEEASKLFKDLNLNCNDAVAFFSKNYAGQPWFYVFDKSDVTAEPFVLNSGAKDETTVLRVSVCLKCSLLSNPVDIKHVRSGVFYDSANLEPGVNLLWSALGEKAPCDSQLIGEEISFFVDFEDILEDYAHPDGIDGFDEDNAKSYVAIAKRLVISVGCRIIEDTLEIACYISAE